MLSRLLIAWFLLFSAPSAPACSFYCLVEAKLAQLEARGFPAGADIFHGRVQRWISAREVEVQVIEAFSGNRETKHLIGPPASQAWCDGSTFSPNEEFIYFPNNGAINACSRAIATPDALIRLRAIAARTNNVDEVARKARFEAAVSAASAAAQLEARRKATAEETLRQHQGSSLFKPASLRSLDPFLASSLKSYQADADFVNVRTGFVDRLAIDAPVMIFEVDNKKYRFVGTLNRISGQPMDSWEGRTLTGDTAGISRGFDLMLGEIQADGRRFRLVAFGDAGFIAEVNPELEENSRMPQEMARAKLAKENAAREAALHSGIVPPVYAGVPPLTTSATLKPPPPPSKEKECEDGLELMSRFKKFESFRQPQHFRVLLAQWRNSLEADLTHKQCRAK